MTPLWAITILFAGVLMLSMMIGTRLRRLIATDPATVASGQLIFGTLSILSLLVGFTFSLALNRHDQRSDLLLEESNAILALHRALVHVDEPARTQISSALHVYAAGRLEYVQSNLFQQEAQHAIRTRERASLNYIVAEVVPRSDMGMNQAQILPVATRILDAGTKMNMISMAHVPVRVVIMLLLLSTGSALVIGISIGEKLGSVWIPASIWALLLSFALFTIVDLDTPQWGSIRIDPSPLVAAVNETAVKRQKAE